MKDGTVLLWKARGFGGWCIKVVTGMPWAHAASYVEGFTWEWTVWWIGYWWASGVKVTEGLGRADEYRQTIVPMTTKQVEAELHYWLSNLNRRRLYNWLKLLSQLIVYPCRRFFNRIGWVPFDNPIWGEECSAGVDEAKRAAGIDLLPGQREGYTAPGDIRKSKLLQRVEV